MGAINLLSLCPGPNPFQHYYFVTSCSRVASFPHALPRSSHPRANVASSVAPLAAAPTNAAASLCSAPSAASACSARRCSLPGKCGVGAGENRDIVGARRVLARCDRRELCHSVKNSSQKRCRSVHRVEGLLGIIFVISGHRSPHTP